MLIIDDNVDACDLYREVFEQFFPDVDIAHDGAAALAKAAGTGSYDVAIVDIGLPDMDGYDLAHALRSTPSGGRLVLVAITGHARSNDRARALAVGFDLHVPKPVTDILALGRELARLVEKRRHG